MAGVNTSLNSYSLSGPFLKTDAKLGYNANTFLRFKIASLVIQPEFGFMVNRTGLTYTENLNSIESNYTQSQFYGGTMVGLKLANIRFMAGPLIYNNTSESNSSTMPTSLKISTISANNSFNWGGQIGLGIDIAKKWSFDARFQKVFTNSLILAEVSSVPNNLSLSQGSIFLTIGYSFLKM